MIWGKILALIAAILLVWWLVNSVRRQPEAFSKQNLSKSFTTMAVLALVLIAFIVFCVMLLKKG